MELVASVLIALVVVELYAWLPTISERLLKLAIVQLRTEDQERCREEWKAQLDDLPNTLVRLIHAISLTAAAGRINSDVCRDKLDGLNERLKCLRDLHHHTRAKLAEIKTQIKNYKQARPSWLDNIEKGLFKSVASCSFQTPQFHSSVIELQTSTAKFVVALRAALEKSDFLMEGMVEKHAIKIEEIEAILHEGSRALDDASTRFRRSLISSKCLMNLIESVEKKTRKNRN